MGIQLHTADTDLMLLHALPKPVTGLSGCKALQIVQFLAGQLAGDHTLGHAPEFAVSCLGFEIERLHLCVNSVVPVVVFHESAWRVQKL